MTVQYILLDDSNPEHRNLSIWRKGVINRVRLEDKSYRAYGSMEIDAHDYAAMFHFNVAEVLNALAFISESGNGLDSWDESFLHNSSLGAMKRIIGECRAGIEPDKSETILLGWQDQPVSVAYMRNIDTSRFLAFLDTLMQFVEETEAEGCDLEFIL